MKAYVRSVETSNDIGKIWSNELDALLRRQRSGHPGLSEQSIGDPEAPAQDGLVFISRPGLADCRQSQVIIEALGHHLRDRVSQ